MTYPLNPAALDKFVNRLRRVHDVDCELYGDPDGQTAACTCSWVERKEAADAITALRAERDTLNRIRVQLAQDSQDHLDLAKRAEAERDELVRDKKARSMIDPITRMHNLCDHLAEQRDESPFTADALELADASYKELCRKNATLQNECNELRADRDSWADQADDRAADCVEQIERADKAEAERDALRKLLLRWLQAHNKMDGKHGLTISEFDSMRQETHAAIAAAPSADAPRGVWRMVKDAQPPPHKCYSVRHPDSGEFKATPCYGLHEPWWVEDKECEPMSMRDSDEWFDAAPSAENEK